MNCAGVLGELSKTDIFQEPHLRCGWSAILVVRCLVLLQRRLPTSCPVGHCLSLTHSFAHEGLFGNELLQNCSMRSSMVTRDVSGFLLTIRLACQSTAELLISVPRLFSIPRLHLFYG